MGVDEVLDPWIPGAMSLSPLMTLKVVEVMPFDARSLDPREQRQGFLQMVSIGGRT